MIKDKMLYDFDDLLIMPDTVSQIRSRSMCNPYDQNDMLPIMTAPMDTVVDRGNLLKFGDNRINVVMPRGTANGLHSITNTLFYSYGLQEFEDTFLNAKSLEFRSSHVLIDIANGHMNHLITIIKAAKLIYGDRLVLMVGNIANPETFKQLNGLVEYVRIGIGNGGGCLTTEQTGVGYPMASLIDACAYWKRINPQKTKIVADGGMKKYADVVKALALGADYVMLGSILNKALESCGENFVKFNEDFIPLARYQEMVDSNYFIGAQTREPEDLMREGLLYKKFRGMSTKEVQLKWGRDPKTSEGVTRFNKVEYTLEGWSQNFEHYLRSAMSYTNSENLKEFGSISTVLNVISKNAFKRYNK